jgi:hypothetical protein
MLYCMSLYFPGVLLLLMLSCGRHPADTSILQMQIDSLQRRLNDSYRPGLGEFMLGIQVHHAKLWFSGTAGNWPLSNFESAEIRESIDDIERYCRDRPEVAAPPMIKPPLDSIDAAIRDKNIAQFKRSFILLTGTCNNCHRATKHEFNVLRIPDSPPFDNQIYQPK